MLQQAQLEVIFHKIEILNYGYSTITTFHRRYDSKLITWNQSNILWFPIECVQEQILHIFRLLGDKNIARFTKNLAEVILQLDLGILFLELWQETANAS